MSIAARRILAFHWFVLTWETGEPFWDRDLGRDQGGNTPITVIQDFEQVLDIRSGERVIHTMSKVVTSSRITARHVWHPP
jgi:hypothetical protein